MKQLETWQDRDGNTWPVRVKREEHQPKLVKFGRGRTVIDYGAIPGGRSHCECYDDPENFFAPSRWWTHTHAERRDPAQFEGVPWVDVRKAVETDAGYRMAVSGPMVDVDLPPNAVEQCPEPSELFASAVAENAFGGMLALHKACKAAGRVGSLDSIDLARWLAMWREAGAKMGTIRNGQFVES